MTIKLHFVSRSASTRIRVGACARASARTALKQPEAWIWPVTVPVGFSRAASNSNRLMGFSQALRTVRGATLISSSTSTVNYTRDAAGNLTGDGLRTFDYDASNRHVKTTVSDPDEGSKITYLYNALGQRTFKSEPQVDHLAPNATQLGSTFVNWLLSNFSWLFAAAQTNATLGQSYLYDGDQAGALGQTPVLLGEYGNGSANSSARLEYIWLPTEAGQAIPVGLYRAGELFAIHSDHLGSPRRLTNSLNRTDWQLPYSAFGETRPTGTITPTTDATLAFALDAATGTRLATTSPPFALNLRFAGQYFDSESNLNYNYFRSYQPTQGRYTQSDPIGLEGGLNRFGYVNQNPLQFTDPSGLVSLVGQVGASYVPGLGGEGNVGVFLTINSGKVDLGYYTQGGLSVGFQSPGISAQVGLVKGDVNTIRGITKNFNGAAPIMCGTVMTDDLKNPLGFTVGAGAKLGGSLTYSDTGAWSLGEAIGRVFDRMLPKR